MSHADLTPLHGLAGLERVALTKAQVGAEQMEALLKAQPEVKVFERTW